MTVTDYIEAASGASVVIKQGLWVQLTNNSTATAYVSQAATDATGKFTVAGVPIGQYTVATGPTNTGPWTGTGNASYTVSSDGSASSIPLAAVSGGAGTGVTNTFTLEQIFRGVVLIRADDSASPSNTAPINMKPAGDGTAGVFQGYSSDTVGYIHHYTDSAAMTGDGLIGLGLSHAGTGLVVSMHAGNSAGAVGIAINTEATQLGTGLKVTQFSSAPLAIFEQAASGTPGVVLAVQQWGNAAAGHSLSLQDVSGNEYGFFGNDLLWHLISSTQGHEVKWNIGAGVDQKMYVYTGSPGLFWAADIVATTNHLKLQTSTTSQAKGSESMVTLIDIANGNQLSFFGATAISQPSAVGAATGYAAGTTAATFHSDDKYTGNTGTTGYTINGIVAALKGLGLIAA